MMMMTKIVPSNFQWISVRMRLEGTTIKRWKVFDENDSSSCLSREIQLHPTLYSLRLTLSTNCDKLIQWHWFSYPSLAFSSSDDCLHSGKICVPFENQHRECSRWKIKEKLTKSFFTFARSSLIRFDWDKSLLVEKNLEFSSSYNALKCNLLDKTLSHLYYLPQLMMTCWILNQKFQLHSKPTMWESFQMFMHFQV